MKGRGHVSAERAGHSIDVRLKRAYWHLTTLGAGRLLWRMGYRARRGDRRHGRADDSLQCRAEQPLLTRSPGARRVSGSASDRSRAFAGVHPCRAVRGAHCEDDLRILSAGSNARARAMESHSAAELEPRALARLFAAGAGIDTRSLAAGCPRCGAPPDVLDVISESVSVPPALRG